MNPLAGGVMGQASYFDGYSERGTAYSENGRVHGIARWEIRDRAQGARQSIVSTAQACIDGLGDGTLAADAFARERFASLEVCRRLNGFVTEYAHILGALGHDARSATELAAQAVVEAAAPYDPPPELVGAVRGWSLGAFDKAAGR